jgi:predicted secreted hydrolase
VRRRALLLAAGLPLLPRAGAASPVVRPRSLVFPRDHGAHPEFRTEWWYVTGVLNADADFDAQHSLGFQLTFFRSRTDLAEDNASRFAARQLLFAHAAVSDLAGGRLVHAERIARWSGDPAARQASAGLADTALRLADWRLERRADGRCLAQFGDRRAGFGCELDLTPTQPLLLQGDAGLSRKGPEPAQASHYYSLPQLRVDGLLTQGQRRRRVTGTAWLDHEWSETLLHPQAVGWDWIGMNLLDGGALTAFRLRRADGSTLWAGGSHRPRSGAVRSFAAADVAFKPGRVWTSPQSQARYPVEWTVSTPAGHFEVRALLDAQELDSRASTGAIYWEGLSELRALDLAGTPRAGLGYLEMTGLASPLRLG